MTTAALIRLAEMYAQHLRLAMTTVGRLAMGHGHSFRRLAAGRVTIRRAERALQWFSEHWPPDLAWPEDISRPAPNQPPAPNPPTKP